MWGCGKKIYRPWYPVRHVKTHLNSVTDGYFELNSRINSIGSRWISSMLWWILLILSLCRFPYDPFVFIESQAGHTLVTSARETLLKTGLRVSRGFLYVSYPPRIELWTLDENSKKGKWKGMRESCLVYCYSGIQSLFEVVLLYTFYTDPFKDSFVIIIINRYQTIIYKCLSLGFYQIRNPLSFHSLSKRPRFKSNLKGLSGFFIRHLHL